MIHNLSFCYHVDMTTIGLGSAKVEVLSDMILNEHLFPLRLHGHDSWIYNYLCNRCLSPLEL